MAGRPKRDIAVEVVFLRLPKDLVQRVTQCAGILQTREGVKRNTTQAYARLLEIACDAVAHQQTPLAPLAPLAVSETSKLAEIASIANGAPTAYDDMLACLGDEEEETPVLPVDGLQAAQTPEPAPASPVNGTQVLELAEVLTEAAAFLEDEEDEAPAEPVLEQTPSTKTPAPSAKTPAKHALPSEKLQEIADVAAEYEKLSLDQLAQLLYDRNIYRARDSQTREEKPVNRGTLQKWLVRARAGGMY